MTRRTCHRIEETRYGFATPRVRWEVREGDKVVGQGATKRMALEDVSLRDMEREARCAR